MGKLRRGSVQCCQPWHSTIWSQTQLQGIGCWISSAICMGAGDLKQRDRYGGISLCRDLQKLWHTQNLWLGSSLTSRNASVHWICSCCLGWMELLCSAVLGYVWGNTSTACAPGDLALSLAFSRVQTFKTKGPGSHVVSGEPCKVEIYPLSSEFWTSLFYVAFSTEE